MKKYFSFIVFIMAFMCLGLIGCGDIYANMKIDVDTTPITLYVGSSEEGKPQSTEITATITGAKDASILKQVDVYFDVPNKVKVDGDIIYDGNVAKITISAISDGVTNMYVRSSDNSKIVSDPIQIRVIEPITDFAINEDMRASVMRGGELNLTKLFASDTFNISYTPESTSETDLEFFIKNGEDMVAEVEGEYSIVSSEDEKTISLEVVWKDSTSAELITLVAKSKYADISKTFNVLIYNDFKEANIETLVNGENVSSLILVENYGDVVREGITYTYNKKDISIRIGNNGENCAYHLYTSGELKGYYNITEDSTKLGIVSVTDYTGSNTFLVSAQSATNGETKYYAVVDIVYDGKVYVTKYKPLTFNVISAVDRVSITNGDENYTYITNGGFGLNTYVFETNDYDSGIYGSYLKTTLWTDSTILSGAKYKLDVKDLEVGNKTYNKDDVEYKDIKESIVLKNVSGKVVSWDAEFDNLSEVYVSINGTKSNFKSFKLIVRANCDGIVPEFTSVINCLVCSSGGNIDCIDDEFIIEVGENKNIEFTLEKGSIYDELFKWEFSKDNIARCVHIDNSLEFSITGEQVGYVDFTVKEKQTLKKKTITIHVVKVANFAYLTMEEQEYVSYSESVPIEDKETISKVVVAIKTGGTSFKIKYNTDVADATIKSVNILFNEDDKSNIGSVTKYPSSSEIRIKTKDKENISILTSGEPNVRIRVTYYKRIGDNIEEKTDILELRVATYYQVTSFTWNGSMTEMNAQIYPQSELSIENQSKLDVGVIELSTKIVTKSKRGLSVDYNVVGYDADNVFIDSKEGNKCIISVKEYTSDNIEVQACIVDWNATYCIRCFITVVSPEPLSGVYVVNRNKEAYIEENVATDATYYKAEIETHLLPTLAYDKSLSYVVCSKNEDDEITTIYGIYGVQNNGEAVYESVAEATPLVITKESDRVYVHGNGEMLNKYTIVVIPSSILNVEHSDENWEDKFNSSVKDELTVIVGKGTEDSPYHIASQNDLSKMSDSDKYFVLVNDVTLDSIFKTIGDFSGHFESRDGYYYINNLKTSLFNEFSGEISNIGLRYGATTIEVSTDIIFGFLAKQNDGGTINNVKLYKNSSLDKLSIAVIVDAKTIKVGGLFGVNTGTITSCSGNVDIVVNNNSNENTILYLGGAVGENTGIINKNDEANNSSWNVNIEVRFTGEFDEILTHSAIGGLVGTSNGESSEITGNDVTAKITATNIDNVGGLVGDSSTSITECYVYPEIIGHDNVGGAIGNNAGKIGVNDDDGQVKGISVVFTNSGIQKTSVKGNDYVGGFAGQSSGAIYFSYASSFIDLTMVKTSESLEDDEYYGDIVGHNYIGGFVGNAKADIMSCFANVNLNVVGSDIESNTTTYAGGFVAQTQNYIRFAYMTGNMIVTSVATCYCIGGFIGNNNAGNIYECYSAVNKGEGIVIKQEEVKSYGFSGGGSGSVGESYMADNASGIGDNGINALYTKMQGYKTKSNVYQNWTDTRWMPNAETTSLNDKLPILKINNEALFDTAITSILLKHKDYKYSGDIDKKPILDTFWNYYIEDISPVASISNNKFNIGGIPYEIIENNVSGGGNGYPIYVKGENQRFEIDGKEYLIGTEWIYQVLDYNLKVTVVIDNLYDKYNSQLEIALSDLVIFSVIGGMNDSLVFKSSNELVAMFEGDSPSEMKLIFKSTGTTVITISSRFKSSVKVQFQICAIGGASYVNLFDTDESINIFEEDEERSLEVYIPTNGNTELYSEFGQNSSMNYTEKYGVKYTLADSSNEDKVCIYDGEIKNWDTEESEKVFYNQLIRNGQQILHGGNESVDEAVVVYAQMYVEIGFYNNIGEIEYIKYYLGEAITLKISVYEGITNAVLSVNSAELENNQIIPITLSISTDNINVLMNENKLKDDFVEIIRETSIDGGKTYIVDSEFVESEKAKASNFFTYINENEKIVNFAHEFSYKYEERISESIIEKWTFKTKDTKNNFEKILTLLITWNPTTISNIGILHYIDCDTEEYDEFGTDEATTEICGGRTGLLKITITDKFADYDYLIVSSSENANDKISLVQLCPVLMPGSSQTKLEVTQEYSVYQDAGSIKLTRLEDGIYYLSTLLAAGIPEGITYDVTVCAYKNGKVNSVGDNVLQLTTKFAPYAKLSLVENVSGNAVGRATENTLKLTGMLVNSTISFEISDTKAEFANCTDKIVLRYTENKNGKPISKDNDDISFMNVTNNSFNIDLSLYIGPNAKCSSNGFSITVIVTSINGSEQIVTKSILTLYITDYVIKNIYVEDVDATNTIKANIPDGFHDLKLNYKTTLLSEEEAYELCKKYFGEIGQADFRIYYSNISEQISEDMCELNNLGTIIGNESIWIFGDKRLNLSDKYNYFQLEANENCIGIKGNSINKQAFSTRITRCYNFSTENGYFENCLGKELSDIEEYLNRSNYEYSYNFFIDFVNETDEDTPEFVYTQRDLESMVEGGHYILGNDIVLYNWTPLKTRIGSLDGNGFVLYLNSFNVNDTTDKGAKVSSINVGLFEEISTYTKTNTKTNITITEKTMLKNIILEVSQTTWTDLRDIATVNFGFLVGVNNGGIIYNCELINTYEGSNENWRSNNYEGSMDSKGIVISNYAYTSDIINSLLDTDTYVSTFVLVSPTVKGEETIAHVGGLVGQNDGYITNSRVGRVGDIEVTSTLGELGTLSVNSGINFVGGGTFGGLVGLNNGNIASSYFANGNIIDMITTSNDNFVTGGLVGENTGSITTSYVESQSKIAQYSVYNKISDGGNYVEIAGNEYRVTITKGMVTKLESESESINVIDSIIEFGNEVYKIKYISSDESGIGIAQIQLTKLRGDKQSIYSSSNVGGFVGINSGSIQNSYSNIDIQSSLSVGGFVYKNALHGSIKYCYSTSTISERSEINGVFTGVNRELNILNEGVIEDCYYMIGDNISASSQEIANNVTAQSLCDGTGLSGFVYALYSASGGQIWEKDTATLPKLYQANSIAISSRFLASGGLGNVKGIGTEENPVILYNTKTFKENIFRTDREFFRLIANIDFEGSQYESNSFNNKYLYGNGMTLQQINLLAEQDSTTDYLGLFTEISNARISDLNITIDNIKGTNTFAVGGLAGKIDSKVDINNIMISAISKEASAIMGYNTAGGLAGIVVGDSNRISNIVSSISVYATYNDKINNIEHYYKKTVEVVEKDVAYAGGLIGIVEFSSNIKTAINNPQITHCEVTGDIAIEAEIAGGVFGLVGNCSAISKVKYIVNSDSLQYIKASVIAGGIIGENRGYITRSYISMDAKTQQESDMQFSLDGLVDGQTNKNNLFIGAPYVVGGFVGLNVGSSLEYTDTSGSNSAGQISKSYSRINVMNSNAVVVGGFVGIAVSDIRELKGEFISGINTYRGIKNLIQSDKITLTTKKDLSDTDILYEIEFSNNKFTLDGIDYRVVYESGSPSVVQYDDGDDITITDNNTFTIGTEKYKIEGSKLYLCKNSCNIALYLDNVYTTAKVQGKTSVGGLVGMATAPIYTVDDSKSVVVPGNVEAIDENNNIGIVIGKLQHNTRVSTIQNISFISSSGNAYFNQASDVVKICITPSVSKAIGYPVGAYDGSCTKVDENRPLSQIVRDISLMTDVFTDSIFASGIWQLDKTLENNIFPILITTNAVTAKTISNNEEFFDYIKGGNGGVYEITNDLTFTTGDDIDKLKVLSTEENPITGTIMGKHEDTGGSITITIQNNSVDLSFFGYMNGLNLSNINFVFECNIASVYDIESTETTGTYGLLARTAENCNFKNISITNIKIEDSTYYTINLSNYISMGGMIGESINCGYEGITTNIGNFVYNTRDRTKIHVGGLVGITNKPITGVGTNTFMNISINTNINISGTSICYVGGIIGFVESGRISINSSADLENEWSSATGKISIDVSNKVYVGGILGYGENKDVTINKVRTQENIDVKSKGYYIGGAVGYSENDKSTSVSLSNIKTYGDIQSKSGNNVNADYYVGGLIGQMKGEFVVYDSMINQYGKIVNCASYMNMDFEVENNTNPEKYPFNIGGIAGSLDYSITRKNTKNGAGNIYAFEDNFASGTISMETNRLTYIGGLIGQIKLYDNGYVNYKKIIFANSASDVNLNVSQLGNTSTNDYCYIGGIAGYSEMNTKCCINYGAINNILEKAYVGGIIGLSKNNIASCLSLGIVNSYTEESKIVVSQAVVGKLDKTTGQIAESCYYCVDLTGILQTTYLVSDKKQVINTLTLSQILGQENEKILGKNVTGLEDLSIYYKYNEQYNLVLGNTNSTNNLCLPYMSTLLDKMNVTTNIIDGKLNTNNSSMINFVCYVAHDVKGLKSLINSDTINNDYKTVLLSFKNDVDEGIVTFDLTETLTITKASRILGNSHRVNIINNNSVFGTIPVNVLVSGLLVSGKTKTETGTTRTKEMSSTSSYGVLTPENNGIISNCVVGGLPDYTKNNDNVATLSKGLKEKDFETNLKEKDFETNENSSVFENSSVLKLSITVASDDVSVGGLVGLNNNIVTNSWAYLDLYITNKKETAGGGGYGTYFNNNNGNLVGCNTKLVNYCYAMGRMSIDIGDTGTTSSGEVVGNNKINGRLSNLIGYVNIIKGSVYGVSGGSTANMDNLIYIKEMTFISPTESDGVIGVDIYTEPKKDADVIFSDNYIWNNIGNSSEFKYNYGLPCLKTSYMVNYKNGEIQDVRYTGSGSSNTPYEIENFAELKGIIKSNNSREYALIRNLKAGTSLGNNDKFWATLNGNGYTIFTTNLTNSLFNVKLANSGNTSNSGKLNQILVKGINEWTFSGNSGAGALLSSLEGGIVTNCAVYGIIENGGSGYIGGLIGSMSSGTLQNSWSDVRITTNTQGYIGGLVGQFTKGTIQQCFASGSIITKNKTDNNCYIGGLVGYMKSDSTAYDNNPKLYNCYFSNKTQHTEDNRSKLIKGEKASEYNYIGAFIGYYEEIDKDKDKKDVVAFSKLNAKYLYFDGYEQGYSYNDDGTNAPLNTDDIHYGLNTIQYVIGYTSKTFAKAKGVDIDFKYNSKEEGSAISQLNYEDVNGNGSFDSDNYLGSLYVRQNGGATSEKLALLISSNYQQTLGYKTDKYYGQLTENCVNFVGLGLTGFDTTVTYPCLTDVTPDDMKYEYAIN